MAGKVDVAVKVSPAAIEANAGVDQGSQLALLTMPALFLRAEQASLLSEETTDLARANRNIQVVTVSPSNHNIHRGQFAAFMAELEPCLDAS